MPRPETGPCAVPGCVASGEYRAPRSRENLREHQWFCLDHVREFNKEWDFFKGMSGAEIEAFMHDAVTGHRPTWERENVGGKKGAEYQRMLEEELRRFTGAGPARAADGRRINAKERRALAALELDAPREPEALKSHYRALVKRCHPDLHGGDRAMEEKFKAITAAYAYLLALYQRA